MVATVHIGIIQGYASVFHVFSVRTAFLGVVGGMIPTSDVDARKMGRTPTY